MPRGHPIIEDTALRAIEGTTLFYPSFSICAVEKISETRCVRSGPIVRSSDLLTSAISTPTPKQNPQITILFNAVPVPKPLVLADALAWREALDAVIGEAKSVVEELKP
jgi:capsular polysaccharide biosynthesis protein